MSTTKEIVMQGGLLVCSCGGGAVDHVKSITGDAAGMRCADCGQAFNKGGTPISGRELARRQSPISAQIEAVKRRRRLQNELPGFTAVAEDLRALRRRLAEKV